MQLCFRCFPVLPFPLTEYVNYLHLLSKSITFLRSGPRLICSVQNAHYAGLRTHSAEGGRCPRGLSIPQSGHL